MATMMCHITTGTDDAYSDLHLHAVVGCEIVCILKFITTAHVMATRHSAHTTWNIRPAYTPRQIALRIYHLCEFCWHHVGILQNVFAFPKCACFICEQCFKKHGRQGIVPYHQPRKGGMLAYLQKRELNGRP